MVQNFPELAFDYKPMDLTNDLPSSAVGISLSLDHQLVVLRNEAQTLAERPAVHLRALRTTTRL